jgi:serine/threonine-protein kinase ULK/ATG1
LKPSNILIANNVFKIADFGFCKTLMHDKDLTKTMIGSPIYMAPEALKGDLYNTGADIWSIGVILFELIYGFCPYEDRTI